MNGLPQSFRYIHSFTYSNVMLFVNRLKGTIISGRLLNNGFRAARIDSYLFVCLDVPDSLPFKVFTACG